MEKTNFWNDAAKNGAIIGAVLAVSMVLETMMSLSGSMKLYLLMSLEWIAVVILHYYLLHSFTRSRSNLYTAEEGFSFGQGYGYILTISAFAGIITGLVQYIYLHLILGYSNYTAKMATAMTDMISRSGGGVPASMESMVIQTIEQVQNSPEPSVIATVWSGVWVSLLFGALFGLIMAGVISRSPKPFDTAA
ncbi:DUF4199 domain-containing protein [uncultured Alistipes sp.]|jgi:hypothetical protein|uniref:DUF4199 domain-containing protein n=1 Tax=uncultured Alistipes sp. TaxID=538949 RepID=UPI0025F8A539|nr:DUF4199 domain-containing protein [uncultured Alistipes sp.]